MKKVLIMTILCIGFNSSIYADESSQKTAGITSEVSFELSDTECVNLVENIEDVQCEFEGKGLMQVTTEGICSVKFQVYDYELGTLTYKVATSYGEKIRGALSSFINGASGTLLSRTNNMSEEDQLKSALIENLKTASAELLKSECTL